MSNTTVELENIWSKAVGLIEESGELDSVMIDTYFKDVTLYRLNPLKAFFSVPSKIHQFILNEEKQKIKKALIEVTNYPELEVDFICEEDLVNYDESFNYDKIEIEDNLIPEFRFDNFVEGPSNRESYMAAYACASNPQSFLYSPLYIYGDSGLGKTHLLHAIGNYIKAHHPEMNILYLTSDEFITRVVSASHDKKLKELKEQMMSLDVFLLDDIQFLAGGKVTSSETLFNIYNQLQKKKKLIVITSDKKPWEIKELEERLVSRLSNGLTCSIESPEYETALKILKMKVENRTEEVNIDEEVLSYIAKYYSHDVRALEGRLTRLLFYSLQFGDTNQITYELAMEAFKDDAEVVKKNEITISKIQNVVSEYYGISKSQLISKSKMKNLSDARSIAIYLCRKHLDVPFKKIGDEFGRRDHTTIMSANTKIESRLKSDTALQMAISEIEKELL